MMLGLLLSLWLAVTVVSSGNREIGKLKLAMELDPDYIARRKPEDIPLPFFIPPNAYKLIPTLAKYLHGKENNVTNRLKYHLQVCSITNQSDVFLKNRLYLPDLFRSQHNEIICRLVRLIGHVSLFFVFF